MRSEVPVQRLSQRVVDLAEDGIKFSCGSPAGILLQGRKLALRAPFVNSRSFRPVLATRKVLCLATDDKRRGSFKMFGVSTKSAAKVPAKDKVQILGAESLSRIPWLIHAFSTRQGGYSKTYGGNALNLGYTKHDSLTAVEGNPAAFLPSVGAVGAERKTLPLLTLPQIPPPTLHPLHPL